MTEPKDPKKSEKDEELRRISKEMTPYVIGFILGVIVLKFVLYWMMKQGWLYWDDGPGYR